MLHNLQLQGNSSLWIFWCYSVSSNLDSTGISCCTVCKHKGILLCDFVKGMSFCTVCTNRAFLQCDSSCVIWFSSNDQTETSFLHNLQAKGHSFSWIFFCALKYLVAQFASIRVFFSMIPLVTSVFLQFR